VYVGNSAKGRKGTAAGRVKDVTKLADEIWFDARTASGLSSGEQWSGMAIRCHPLFATAGIGDFKLLRPERSGLVGAVIARSEAQVIRLSLIYALLVRRNARGD
jgi:hypothetical protein